MEDCTSCKFHQVYFDEDFDGCVCWNDEGHKYHIDNCSIEYLGVNPIPKGCPYYEKEEEE
jgi:hypothetical protein